MTEVVANGIRLYYEEHGEGDTILCLRRLSRAVPQGERPAAALLPHAEELRVEGGHVIDPAHPEIVRFLERAAIA